MGVFKGKEQPLAYSLLCVFGALCAISVIISNWSVLACIPAPALVGILVILGLFKEWLNVSSQLMFAIFYFNLD